VADFEALALPFICLASNCEPAKVVALNKEALAGRDGSQVGDVETYKTVARGTLLL